MVNNTDGSIVGYKYFDLSRIEGRKDVQLRLCLIPAGIPGTIQVMAVRPWQSQGGKPLGTIELRADMPQQPTELTVALPDLSAPFFTVKNAFTLIIVSK